MTAMSEPGSEPRWQARIQPVITVSVVVRTSGDDESISIRSVAWFTLAYDGSRVVGAEAASFLVAVKTLLDDQAFLRQLINTGNKVG